MADTFSKEERSKIMRLVKSSRNKSTELKLLQLFKTNNITGWRRNFRLFGKPDFVFYKHKIAIFLDGCFWHGHNCRNTKPKDNKDYWIAKIQRNKKRDKEVSQILSDKGWRIIRIWECELQDSKQILNRLEI